MQKSITDKELLKFHKKYKSLKICSIAEFARINNLSKDAVRRGFHRLGLEVFPLSSVKRKFQVNDSYFDIIDTEEKAYFLGFIFADGCNSGSRLEVSLAKKDVSILRKLSSALLYGNDNIKEYIRKEKNAQNKVGLYVVSKQICNSLTRLGCCPRKTFVLKFPELLSNLQHHFIRGYFDGDGSITIQKTRCYEAQFSIVSTMEMLKSIGCYINDLGVNFSIVKRHKDYKNNYTLRVSGNRQILKVSNFLYSDSNIFLERKYKIYKNLVKHQKRKNKND